MNKKEKNNKISKKEILESIAISGYLVEQRVESILTNNHFYVDTNPVYKDPFTNKTREYDISAIQATILSSENSDLFSTYIICECINNLQPLVFFIKDSPIPFLFRDEIKIIGNPIKISEKGKFKSLQEFLKMESFHHYCKSPISTQYCSFNKKKMKSAWMATHLDEHHHIFENLMNALESEISKAWYTTEEIIMKKKQRINLSFFYPLLILQQDMYSYKIIKEKISLKKENHIRFRKSFYNQEMEHNISYQIDVITESYLSDFLLIINDETKKIENLLKKNSKILKTSIAEITEICNKNTKSKPKRNFLEKLL
jgi:hypothetical protein